MRSNACIFLLVAASTQALAGTPCEVVKAGIAAKLDAKHVTHYVLEAVPVEKVGEGKVVGTCEGGTKRIVYTRNEAAPGKDAPVAAAAPSG